MFSKYTTSETWLHSAITKQSVPKIGVGQHQRSSKQLCFSLASPLTRFPVMNKALLATSTTLTGNEPQIVSSVFRTWRPCYRSGCRPADQRCCAWNPWTTCGRCWSPTATACHHPRRPSYDLCPGQAPATAT